MMAGYSFAVINVSELINWFKKIHYQSYVEFLQKTGTQTFFKLVIATRNFA